MAALESTLHCSFCGKSQHDVRTLVAGPNIYICDECTMLTVEINAETTGTDDQLLDMLATLTRSSDTVVKHLRDRGVPWDRIQGALGPS